MAPGHQEEQTLIPRRGEDDGMTIGEALTIHDNMDALGGTQPLCVRLVHSHQLIGPNAGGVDHHAGSDVHLLVRRLITCSHATDLSPIIAQKAGHADMVGNQGTSTVCCLRRGQRQSCVVHMCIVILSRAQQALGGHARLFLQRLPLVQHAVDVDVAKERQRVVHPHACTDYETTILAPLVKRI